MPYNKNTDRTRRRLLRWIAILGSLGVAGYLFFPHVFTGQDAHDTAGGALADSFVHELPPESVELPADAPALPPLIPPYLQNDDELLAQLANEYNLQTPDFGGQAPHPRYITVADTPAAPAPPDKTAAADAHHPASEPPLPDHAIADSTLSLDDHSDTGKALLDLARIGARDLTREPAAQTAPRPDVQTPPPPVTPPPEQSLAAIAARDLSEDVPANEVQLPAVPPDTGAQTVVQDDGKGEFVKKRFSLQKSDIWAALQKSDLNPNLKKQLEPLRRRIAQGNINRVQILYTDYVKNGVSKAENSKILLVDGLRGSTLVWSFYAREKDRKMSFYDYDGNAPELSMDRVPLQYSHITSGFNPARRHPITGRIQAHTGVDFKAAYGAPVHSTGKGVVSFAGWQSGYGRLVIVQHDNGYETRYAHLSAIDVEAGQAVARGALVGKVGNSGASTGTHLHFEVRINGTPYDPMTVAIPSNQPLPGNYMKIWHYRAEQYRIAMNELSKPVKK